MRRLLASALLLVTGVFLLPASAAPVESTRIAEVKLELPTAHGALQLVVYAVHGSAGDSVQVSAMSCNRACGLEQYYSGALPAGALQIDEAQASGQLRTSLGGAPFVVTWSPEIGVGVERGFVDGNGTARSYYGQPAFAKVGAGGRGCQGHATVGTELTVTSSRGGGGYLPLSKLRFPAGTTALRCTG